MPHRPRAITLDLDDTLWPIGPAIARAEAALDAWLRAHAPRTAARWPVPAMRELRDRVARDNPQLAHDYSAQRRLSLALALEAAGDDPALADAAFAAYFAARHEVELYDDALDALRRIARRVPIAALSNGNAELARIGLDAHFVFQLSAREHGAAKPSPCIFHAACARLGEPAHAVLHVGDDPHMDVVGAIGAGLSACWINRHGAPWVHPGARPHLEFSDLAALADWLEADAPAPE
ncbi:HAD-IA family hydrolase [Rehaibacterium terrae]|uniref:Putative hydrolase of the HAD superfamily n=1 Tax=Rehaibacterium terrae TaxID=1341696 RepID=A0A7W7XYJ0_9GAMM|nr:putative hydrolase of the HAD superfamily [Rehaibacterium terrae]